MDAIILEHFPQSFIYEEDCELFLYKLRWPDGFCCPRCDHESCYKINTRKLYECRECRTQFSVTAGTIMHKSKLSLLVWFKAIDLLVDGENEYTSSSLAKELQINYRTARLLLDKLELVLHKQFDHKNFRHKVIQQGNSFVKEGEEIVLRREMEEKAKDIEGAETGTKAGIVAGTNREAEAGTDAVAIAEVDVCMRVLENNGCKAEEERGKIEAPDLMITIEAITRKMELRDVSKFSKRLQEMGELCRKRFSRKGMRSASSNEVVLKWMNACTSVLLFPYFLRYWQPI